MVGEFDMRINFVGCLVCLGVLGSGLGGPLISHVDGIVHSHGGGSPLLRCFLLLPNAPAPNLLKCFTSLIVIYIYLFLNSTAKFSLIVLLSIF